jgi:hypothetical protein
MTTTLTSSLTKNETTGRWTVGTTRHTGTTLDGRLVQTWVIGEVCMVGRIGRRVRTHSRLLRDGRWTAWELDSDDLAETTEQAREWAREARGEARQIARNYLLAAWNEDGERWSA